MNYIVYVLKCADDTLYVGSTNNLERRLHQHNHLKAGARYTRSRRPVKLVHSEIFATHAAAAGREAAIKRMSRTEKLSLLILLPANSNRH